MKTRVIIIERDFSMVFSVRLLCNSLGMALSPDEPTDNQINKFVAAPRGQSNSFVSFLSEDGNLLAKEEDIDELQKFIEANYAGEDLIFVIDPGSEENGDLDQERFSLFQKFSKEKKVIFTSHTLSSDNVIDIETFCAHNENCCFVSKNHTGESFLSRLAEKIKELADLPAYSLPKKPITIIITRSENNYYAHPCEQPEIQAIGISIPEVLGNLIGLRPEFFGVIIGDNE